MKISELIQKLEEAKQKHGDVPVLIHNSGFGGHEIASIDNRIDDLTLRQWDFLEDTEPTKEEVEEYFPDWDGTEENCDDELESHCITLYSGYTLYST